ncbi:MAG TPA: DUF1080 domain-containing protein [Pirellulales bacterium]|jgi:hypothetical protein|nr:DUF1080 domain-containing protein [Pirellulales bacterium]
MPRRTPGRAASLIALLALLASPIVVRAEEPLPKDAEPTSPDYAVQGEYAGEVTTPAGNVAVGVQVIAVGKGKFRGVSYIGGLPGDGWERSPRTGAEAETRDGVTAFKSEEYSSTIKNGVLSVSILGVKIADLKKIDRQSPSLGEAPPEGAVVLFDGSTADHFEKGRMTEDGLLLPGCTSKEKFGSGKLHVEFRVPFMPEARDQGRGNSGVYLQGRYEVQVLDSFGLDESDTGGGAIYSVKAPDQNMCYPPGAWQTYDIDFTAAEYQDGKQVKDPTITVKHNGVPVVRKAAVPQATRSAPLPVTEEPGPLYLQDHGSPVRYRNVWFIKRGAEKPVEKAPETN